jgi:RNA polymerase sigma-70 factor, ECF subfamily
MTAIALSAHNLQPHSSDDEDRLFALWKRSRDMQALESLLRGVIDFGWRVARRSCATAADADDILQESLLRMMESADRFRDGASVRPWLAAIIVNAARMRRRSEQARQRRDGNLSSTLAEFNDSTSELSEAALIEVERLPEHERLPVWLNAVEGLSYRDIARIVKAREGTVRSQISRGLERLREALGRRGFQCGSAALAASLMSGRAEGAPAPIVAQVWSSVNSYRSIPRDPAYTATALKIAAITVVIGASAFGIFVLNRSVNATDGNGAVRPTDSTAMHSTRTDGAHETPVTSQDEKAALAALVATDSDPRAAADGVRLGKDIAKFAQPLLGCWSEKSESAKMKFAADKCFELDDFEQLSAMRVRYDGPGRMTFSGVGSVKYVINGNKLTLSYGGDAMTFEREQNEPEGFRLEPLRLPNPVAIDPMKQREIINELERLFQHGQDTMNGDGLAQAKADRDNAESLEKILLAVGWIDVERFGERSAQQAILLAQQSRRPRLVFAALEHVKHDLDAGRISPRSYAMLYDVSRWMIAEPQEYGTQVMAIDGKPVVFVRNPATLEQRRHSIGLEPMSSSPGVESKAQVREEKWTPIGTDK